MHTWVSLCGLVSGSQVVEVYGRQNLATSILANEDKQISNIHGDEVICVILFQKPLRHIYSSGPVKGGMQSDSKYYPAYTHNPRPTRT